MSTLERSPCAGPLVLLPPVWLVFVFPPARKMFAKVEKQLGVAAGCSPLGVAVERVWLSWTS